MKKNFENQVECPACHCSRLIDKGEGVSAVAYQVGKYPEGWQPDFIQKCHNCGKQIGIKRVS